MKKVFVSFPLTHDDKTIVMSRVIKAKEYCLKLFKEGYIPICPAIMGLALIEGTGENELDIKFETWEEFCYTYMEIANEIHVLMLDEWQKSGGIKSELIKAVELKKEIKYIEI